jgi:hypothetical protein
MKRSDSTIILTLFSLLISSCSNSLSTVPKENSDNFSEKEYTFSGKALTTSYLSRKFNNFLNPVNESKILKELQYGEYKHPELVKEVMMMNPGMLGSITPLSAVLSRRETSPAFDSFIRYLEQPEYIINTIAGDGFQEPGNGYTGFFPMGRFNGDNKLAVEASLNQPFEIAFDFDENIYIADELNDRIRKIDKITGIITTIAGNGIREHNGDGEPAIDASIKTPGFLTFDKTGNLFFTEQHAHQIRKITAINGVITPESIISTIAGDGYTAPGGDYIGRSEGDNGPAIEASFNSPWSLAFDHSGNLYIGEGEGNRVRKITAINGVIEPSSIITTIAGNGYRGFNGDGLTGPETSLSHPWDIVFDKSDNLFISDSFNLRIRKLSSINGDITPESIMTTVAGTGNYGDTGEGGPALEADLGELGGINFDKSGNLLISNYYYHKIKYIDGQGLIHTIAGDGYSDPENILVGRYTGDGGPATQASLYQPWGINVDSLGNIYICDAMNQRIRKLVNKY